MAQIARVLSQNHFSVLADEVIDPSVLEKEQAPKKIEVPPITFTELQHETILAMFGELKIDKFSIKIIKIGHRFLLEDIADYNKLFT